MDILNQTSSPIAQFYAGKSVLVTGATGFIGKVLIEKLLYSCPELDKIYLLIRSRKGKNPSERLAELASQRPLNMRLKQESVIQKLVAIDSDLSADHLGISAMDAEILKKNVSVIFHVAASVKFEAPLEVNMRHNVVATKGLLDFACQFCQLQCFVHVSTAYSNCQLRHIDERVYPMDVPENPLELEVTEEMIDNRPNTYTYTKAMAENVASKYASKINTVIVRPSIVMSALKEPVEGWVDTINGPVGLSVLGATGILQKIKVNSEVVFDLIPVDIVSNALVSIAWAAVERKDQFKFGSPPALAISEAATEQQQQHQTTTTRSNNSKNDSNNNPKSINNNNNNNNNNINNSQQQQQAQQQDGNVRVFNLTTGSENPCTFHHYFSTGREEALAKPSCRALRPLLHIPKQKGMNPIQYYIHKIFSHLLFAYIIDTLLTVFGHKRLVIRAVDKMHHANEVFDFFCSNQWMFNTDNVKRLRELQTEEDKVRFNCDVRAIDWSHYARIGWMGCRRYILNENDDTVEQARVRYRRVCFAYYMVKIVLLISATLMAFNFISSSIFVPLILIPVYSIVYLL